MNFFERVPPADFPDKILGEEERNLTDPPVPFSEKEYFGTAPTNTHEVAPAVKTNSDIPRLERIVTGPHVSTIPGDEASIPSSKPSKKNSLFGGKGIVICAVLSLATGITVGAIWSRTPSTGNYLSRFVEGRAGGTGCGCECDCS